MTRAKYNRNPKLTREQLLPILAQQNVQAMLLLQQLEHAYVQLENANVKIKMLEKMLEEEEKQKSGEEQDNDDRAEEEVEEEK